MAASEVKARAHPMWRVAPLLLLLWLFVAGLTGCETGAAVEPTTQRVMIRDKPFDLELAVTGAQRYQGLSDRASIPDNGGMLFVFTRPQRLTFVMRRCLVPIDLLYLDGGGRIVDMHEMSVEPYDTAEGDLTQYPSAWPAQFVIELQAGTIDKLELELGEKVDMPVEALKTLAE